MNKKITLLLACALLLVACAGNKNILNEKMAKYPADKYITKLAAAQKKDQAKAAALKDLKALFDGLPQSEGSDIRRTAILSKAYAAQWWKDKASGKYYAIAVLERKGAQQTMQPYYVSIDGKLASLMQRINASEDKYVRLKNAMLMPPLFEQREQLDREYRLLSFDASSYDEENLYAFKAAYNKTFYDIKINAVITGADDTAVKTYLIDSLNSMGFAVGENLASYDIELAIQTRVTHTTSQTTEGLFWADSTATVALKDEQTGGIFATFTKFARDGSGRKDEAQRRSLIAVGADSAPVIKQKILEYVERK